MKEVIKILDYACKPHLLYLVIFEGNDELFCKVGITGNDVESRFKNEVNYEILKYTTIKFKNGKEARGVESMLLEQILSMDDKYKPLKQFGGYSECYNANIYGKISKIFKVIPTHKLNIEVEPVKHKLKIENKSFCFSFGRKFECELISIILTDHTFGSGILEVLNANYFEDEFFRKIVITIKNSYEMHEVIPDIDSLEVLLMDSTRDDIQRDFILRQLKFVRNIELYNEYLVQEKALRFCKEQYYRSTINEISKYLSFGDNENMGISESLIEDLFLWDNKFNKSNIGKTFMESKKDKESHSQTKVNNLLDAAKARQKVLEDEGGTERLFAEIDDILKLPTQRMNGNTEEWVLDGQYHREDGPALIFSNGTKHWYLHGKLHCEDGPAIIKCTGTKEWYLHGKLHREDGPAITMGNGSRDEWYLDGEFQREKRYTSKNDNKKLKLTQ